MAKARTRAMKEVITQKTKIEIPTMASEVTMPYLQPPRQWNIATLRNITLCMIHKTHSDVKAKKIMDVKTRRRHHRLLAAASSLIFLWLPRMSMPQIARRD